MNRGRRDEVDLDSLMASVHNRTPTPQSRQRHLPPVRKPAPLPHPQAALPSQMPIQNSPTVKKSGSAKKMIIAAIAILLIGAGAAVAGIWVVPSLLSASNPFSQEMRDDIGIPLYYPTKLPGDFKMETGSINQPESNVVIYAISDNDGKRVNITLQKKPDGLNLDPLYAALKDIEEVDTKFGRIKLGASGDGIVVANILTDKTWIIISGGKGVLTGELLAEIANNLKS